MPLLKLQVLFIKHTSSKFIVTHFEGIAIFDVIFACINETLYLLSDVTLSKNLELLLRLYVCYKSKKNHLYHVSKEDVKWLSYFVVEYYLGKINQINRIESLT